MRTTLDIEDDVLAAVRELARRERSTVGKVISGLLRRALIQAPATPPAAPEVQAEYGFRPFPARGGVVTGEVVDKLRDESGI